MSIMNVMSTVSQRHHRHSRTIPLWSVLLFVLTSQVIWTQNIELLPTGRSLPDTIPSDQIIYLGPFGDERQSTPPDSDPGPLASPSESRTEIERLDIIQEEGIAIIDEFGTIESPETVDLNNMPKFGPSMEPKGAPVEPVQVATTQPLIAPSSTPPIPPQSLVAEEQPRPQPQTKIRGVAPGSAAPIPPNANVVAETPVKQQPTQPSIESVVAPGSLPPIPPDAIISDEIVEVAKVPQTMGPRPESLAPIPPDAIIGDEIIEDLPPAIVQGLGPESLAPIPPDAIIGDGTEPEFDGIEPGIGAPIPPEALIDGTITELIDEETGPEIGAPIPPDALITGDREPDQTITPEIGAPIPPGALIAEDGMTPEIMAPIPPDAIFKDIEPGIAPIPPNALIDGYEITPEIVAPIPPDAIFQEDIGPGMAPIPPNASIEAPPADTIAEEPPLLEFLEPESGPVMSPSATIEDEYALLDLGSYMEPKSGIPPAAYIESGPMMELGQAPDMTLPLTPHASIYETPEKIDEPDTMAPIPPDAEIADQLALIQEPTPEIKTPDLTIATPPSGGIPPNTAVPTPPDATIELPPKVYIEDDMAEADKKPVITNEWVYTLTPAEDRYPPEDTKEKPEEEKVEEEVEVVEVEETPLPAPKPAITERTPSVSDTLAPGHYVQIATYTDQKAALDGMTQLTQKNISEYQKQKITLYKANNSDNYRLLIGPFPKTEVGVELYSVRTYGYRNAYAVSE